MALAVCARAETATTSQLYNKGNEPHRFGWSTEFVVSAGKGLYPQQTPSGAADVPPLLVQFF